MADPIPMGPAHFAVFDVDPETGVPGVFLSVTIPGSARVIATVSPTAAQALAKALLVASVMVGNELGIDLNKLEKLQ